MSQRGQKCHSTCSKSHRRNGRFYKHQAGTDKGNLDMVQDSQTQPCHAFANPLEMKLAEAIRHPALQCDMCSARSLGHTHPRQNGRTYTQPTTPVSSIPFEKQTTFSGPAVTKWVIVSHVLGTGSPAVAKMKASVDIVTCAQ